MIRVNILGSFLLIFLTGWLDLDTMGVDFMESSVMVLKPVFQLTSKVMLVLYSVTKKVLQHLNGVAALF